MAISTAAGTRVFIATGASATTPQTTKTGYDALTWTEVLEVEDIGELGDSANDVTALTLKDGRVRHLKGAKDAGTVNLIVLNDPLDVGQIALIAAEGTAFTYNFKVEYLDKADANDTNSIDYFGAKVMSKRKSVGDADNIIRRTFTLGINTAILEAPSVAVP